MDLYQIPLLRFKTNGSSEREKIMGMLDKVVDSWGAEMYIKSIPYITVLLKKYTDIC